MRTLFFGDIVGDPGRSVVRRSLPLMIAEYGVDLVVANAENASGGVGLTVGSALELLNAGIDVLTGGNHTWRHRELYSLLDQEPRVLRPANYPDGAPGSGVAVVQSRSGVEVAVVNLIGRTFMDAVDCPFQKADEILNGLPDTVQHVIVDFHAEATSEKAALAWHLDGRVTAVIGTHTHVPTADERISPSGTAFITDVGMCGPMDSVLGVAKTGAVSRFREKLPTRFSVARGPCSVQAVLVETATTMSAASVQRVSRVVDPAEKRNHQRGG